MGHLHDVCFSFCCLPTALKALKAITEVCTVKKLFTLEISLNCTRPCSKAIWNSSINCCLFLQADGTDLCHFVHGHETWADYLTYMEQDGAWGDHLILCAAANCFKTCIHVVSSLQNDVVIRPHCPVEESKPLVLGHIHEVHYVSLQPIQVKKGKANVTCLSIWKWWRSINTRNEIRKPYVSYVKHEVRWRVNPQTVIST